VERLNAEPRLKGALAGVTAAVVGVILNLTVWFALHVLFAEVHQRTLGPLRILVPEPGSADVVAMVLAAIAAGLLFGLHRGVVATLLTLFMCGGLALAWHWATALM
jgi:chromate transporter